MLSKISIERRFSKSDIIGAILPLTERGQGTEKEQKALNNTIILFLMNLKDFKKTDIAAAFSGSYLTFKDNKLIFKGTHKEAIDILTKLINEL